MLPRLKFQINGLVNEILDKLPGDVFKSSTTTFLDPAMAGGQFVVEIIKRLRDNGHSDDNIAGRVFGLAEDIIDLNFAVNKYKIIGKYTVGSIEKLQEWTDMGMKFDVVVGNPPYQNGERAIYSEFYKIAHTLSKEHIIFIAPTSWLLSNKSSMKRFREFIISSGLLEVKELNAQQVFGVKIDMLGITVHNVLRYMQSGEYTYITTNGDVIKCTGLNPPVLHTDERVASILQKMTANGDELGAFNTYIRGLNNKGLCENGETSAIESADHCNKIITRVSGGNIEYAWTRSNKNPHQGLFRVAFGRLTSTTSLGTITILDEMDATTSELVVYIPTTSKAEADRLYKYLNSPLFKFVLPYKRPGTTNAIGALNTIRRPVIDRSLTNEELYKHFNLTQDEIDLIESTVK